MSNLGRAAGQLNGIARSLRTMGHRAEDIAPVLRKIGTKVALANRRAFATRGASNGEPWKPLAASTILSKSRHGYSRAPLVRTGALRQSFVGRPMGIEHYSGKSAQWGSPLQTAAWQQKGTFHNGKRHIPPRKIMKITRSQRKEYVHMIAEYVVKGKK